MKREPTLQTRREFIRSTVVGGALTWTVPSFLANTFAQLHADAADKSTQVETGRDSRILIVLQLAGGNDGLNTVVPFANDHYHRARPRIGLGEDRVLKVNDEIGLHPALQKFKDLHDSGRLAIVQGVGYPNPNRSHFRSSEIWQTASDSGKFERYGWLGRYFDNTCAGADPTVAVSIGRQMPQAFAAKVPKAVSLDNPQNYRFIDGEDKATDPTMMENAFRKLNQVEDENSGGTIGQLPGTVHHAGGALDFLERTALDVQLSSDKIRAINSRVQNQASYPGSQLGNALKLVAKLIAGGLATRVFYVSQGGYDTHTNQPGNHERLLRDLGESVGAFVKDLEAQGNLERTLLMTFSEFGRRVAENANSGTDHGAAAPMFLIGGQIKPGLLGKYPSLAPADLFQGDIQFTTDFRSVYATVLEKWLRTKSGPILGHPFPRLEIL